jgi:hypothetical protein
MPAAFQPASPVPTVSGQSIAKAHWGPRKRAYFAAQWKAGMLNVEPTTALAALVFGVCVQLVRQATNELQLLYSAAAQNGVPATPPNPIESDWWVGLSEPARDDFVRAHFNSVWASVERLTR